MGIVRRQSILSSLITYVGFAIGAFNLLFLFGKFFTPEQVGLTRLITDIGLVFSTLCTLGSIPAINKFYPFYESYLPKAKNDLGFIAIVLCSAGFIMFYIFGHVFSEFLFRKFSNNSPLFVSYQKLIYPFTFSLLTYTLFEAFAYGAKKTVLCNFLREVFSRTFIAIILLLTVFHVLSFDQFMDCFSLMYAGSALILITYLIVSKNLVINFNISSLSRRLSSKLVSFSLFVFSTAVLGVIIRTNDVFILSSVTKNGLKNAAIFTYASYFITMMDVPFRSIGSISIPILAESWKNRDFKNIEVIYKRSALNLVIAGLFIFISIWLCIDNIISYLGPSYEALKWPVLILGIAKLIDLGTGVNGYIVSTSKFWKFDFFTYVIFALISLPMNYFLIKNMGLIGGAISNLIALIIFNSIRYFFILKWFKIQPFNKNNLLCIVGAGAIYCVVNLLPFIHDIYTDSFISVLLFVSLYSYFILKLKLSEDADFLFGKVLKLIKKDNKFPLNINP